MRSSIIVASLLASLPLVLSQDMTGFDPTKIPASCLSAQCQNYVDAVTNGNCLDLDCLCTNTAANAMKTCLQCIADAGTVAGYDQSVLDQTLQAFVDGCATVGHPITISGVSGGKPSTPSVDPSDPADPADPADPTDAPTSPSTRPATRPQTTPAGAGASATAPGSQTTSGGGDSVITKTGGAATTTRLSVGSIVIGAAIVGAALL